MEGYLLEMIYKFQIEGEVSHQGEKVNTIDAAVKGLEQTISHTKVLKNKCSPIRP